MGVSVASNANNNICLAPSDSAAETSAQIDFYTARGQTRESVTLWRGARYENVDVPVGEAFDEYQVVGGTLRKLSQVDNIENLRKIVYRLHDFFDSLSDGLEGREARLWKSEIVAKAHNWVRELHYGANVIILRRVPSVASLTIQQRIRWCQQTMLGPFDIRHIPVTDVKGRIRKVYDTLSTGGAGDPGTPDNPVTYINPLVAPTQAEPHKSSIPLATAIGLSGTGTYKDASNQDQTGLGLNGVDTFEGLDSDGTWIQRIST